jgi:hypothetical protein
MSNETSDPVGKRILIGLIYLGHDGAVTRQLQLHGIVTKVDEGTLCFERADGGGTFSAPNDGSLASADPEALYTLRTTGEAVSGVDYVASWAIHAAPHSRSLDKP